MVAFQLKADFFLKKKKDVKTYINSGTLEDGRKPSPEVFLNVME